MKRLMDILLAACGLVLLSPVLLFVALVVQVSLGSPVLFRQQRPGLHGRPFTLIKFRTMRDSKDSSGTVRPDQERLTRLGRVFRSTSLDELPELWNVLVGDMSLVGPRPLLMEYLPLYSPQQARRHNVRPGITGWAQVNGRNALTWERKFELDVWYVDHQSFWLDVRILCMSVATILRARGISQQSHPTAEVFRGSAR